MYEIVEQVISNNEKGITWTKQINIDSILTPSEALGYMFGAYIEAVFNYLYKIKKAKNTKYLFWLWDHNDGYTKNWSQREKMQPKDKKQEYKTNVMQYTRK